MKSYFAYIRVSTVKQGEHGSSLIEQRSAIEAYAAKHDLRIEAWFEEMETAAKLGRREFARLIADLLKAKAAGVIIHKIDRSARNLKDWSQINDLMDAGIEVHFAHESLDMGTRGGRLAADIQAVVAADYIRNLRDEVKKGFYGRLKQGFYPLPAPRGYLDRGKAKAKEIDPVIGPLVRLAFELYASGNYSLHTLRAEMATRGLLGTGSRPLSQQAMAIVLHNPFYIGLMRIGTTGETFEGNHQPIISKSVFDRVQSTLSGRLYPRTQIHKFRFRRLLKCWRCGRSLTGELQKGHVYYRCHDRGCHRISIVETKLDAFVVRELEHLRVDEGDIGEFRDLLCERIVGEDAEANQRISNIRRELGSVDERMIRLTDALLDGTIDKASYDERKKLLIGQRLTLRESLQSDDKLTFWKTISERFELGFVALQSYISGNDDEKREIVKIISSNLIIYQNRVEFPMFSPFGNLRDWSILAYGGHRRDAHRISHLVNRRESMRKLIDTMKAEADKIQSGT